MLSTTEGQRAFWAADCEVVADRARFDFPQAPMDLEAAVSTEEDRLVCMRVTSGFPFWEGSTTWKWELGAATRAGIGTSVLFCHYAFGKACAESDLGHTAHTWTLILDRPCRRPVTPRSRSSRLPRRETASPQGARSPGSTHGS